MLTERKIQSAMRTVTKETTLKDSDGRRGAGVLALRIRQGATGNVGTWVAMWERQGKRSSQVLGRYPETTLALARDKFAAELRPVIAAGKVPAKAQAMGEGATVEALAKAYHAHLVATGTRRPSEYERILLTGLRPLVDRLGRQRMAASIEPGDVAEALRQTDERGARRQADIERTTLVAMFNYGIRSTHDYRSSTRQDWGLKINPAAVIPRDTGAVVARERNLNAAEMKAVWWSAPGETGDVLRMVILCGQRVLETLRMEGRDVDLQAAMWTMPAAKTKGGKRPHAIPLPRQALPILQRLVALHGVGYLFPARAGAAGELIGVPSVSRAAARLKCCEAFQPRDLRRTWKSRAGEAGIDRFTRDLMQQHAQSDTGSRHYDRHDYMPQLREAMRKWELWLDANVTGAQLAKAA